MFGRRNGRDADHVQLIFSEMPERRVDGRGYNVGVRFYASLPLHPLLVHIPVVLVPLLFAGTLAMAVRRSWVDRFGVLAGGLAIVAGLGTALASQSGESLQESVARTAAVHNHVELGDQAKAIIVVFLFALIGWTALNWWFARLADRRPASARTILTALMALSVVLGALATVWVTRAGHSGATAVWDGKTSQTGG